MAQQNPSTQEFIVIDDIQDDVVILKDGGLRQILMVSGVNLDLKSEEEQRIVLMAYQNFLNSLDFSIQFLVHSRKFNIENYLNFIDGLKEREQNELLKNQIFEYREFIKSFVEQNNIMTKIFLAVVPFYPPLISFSNKKGFFKKIFGGGEETPKEKLNGDLQIHISQLKQRTDHVIEGLQSIGLRTVILNNEELMELFYNFYNPETVEKTHLNIAQQKNG